MILHQHKTMRLAHKNEFWNVKLCHLKFYLDLSTTFDYIKLKRELIRRIIGVSNHFPLSFKSKEYVWILSSIGFTSMIMYVLLYNCYYE